MLIAEFLRERAGSGADRGGGLAGLVVGVLGWAGREFDWNSSIVFDGVAADMSSVFGANYLRDWSRRSATALQRRLSGSGGSDSSSEDDGDDGLLGGGGGLFGCLEPNDFDIAALESVRERLRAAAAVALGGMDAAGTAPVAIGTQDATGSATAAGSGGSVVRCVNVWCAHALRALCCLATLCLPLAYLKANLQLPSGSSLTFQSRVQGFRLHAVRNLFAR